MNFNWQKNYDLQVLTRGILVSEAAWSLDGQLDELVMHPVMSIAKPRIETGMMFYIDSELRDTTEYQWNSLPWWFLAQFHLSVGMLPCSDSNGRSRGFKSPRLRRNRQSVSSRVSRRSAVLRL